MTARNAAWRVPGSSVPYQFSKYNLPMFNKKVGENNLPGIQIATVTKQINQQGRGLFRWRRRVRDMGGYNKGVMQQNKHLYNAEWVGFMRSRLAEVVNHRTLILLEEEAMLADRYGHTNVANLLQPPVRDTPAHRFVPPAEGAGRPKFPTMIKHRAERDQPVHYLRPQGQHAYNLSFFPGKGTATQLE
eukprot:TRINITY_DN16573_c0_g1_i1.p1 TRINITY_DN16573_c0_g1~~TRINITY_DN16573_c0_g1_i1.p1  ORF type:complete len:188 (+),score=39.53 TRINITY_DN16573_c0_g1_i1:159-722(+)